MIEQHFHDIYKIWRAWYFHQFHTIIIQIVAQIGYKLYCHIDLHLLSRLWLFIASTHFPIGHLESHDHNSIPFYVYTGIRE